MNRRIQRRRTAGWRMPEGAVSVTRPGRWGNPFVVSNRAPLGEVIPNTGCLSASSPRDAVEQYRAQLTERPQELAAVRRDLANHDLACWCSLCPAHADGKPFGVKCADCEPCHADVLGRVAAGLECVGV